MEVPWFIMKLHYFLTDDAKPSLKEFRDKSVSLEFSEHENLGWF